MCCIERVWITLGRTPDSHTSQRSWARSVQQRTNSTGAKLRPTKTWPDNGMVMLSRQCKRNHPNPVFNSNSDCVECNRERAREWRLKNGERSRSGVKAWQRKHPLFSRYRKYDITESDLEQLLVKQDKKCAACSQELVGRWAVDHDHKTGRVRGLLCQQCNVALGMLADSVIRIDQLKTYIILQNGDVYA